MARSWLLLDPCPKALDLGVRAGADRLVIDLAACESGAEGKARDTVANFLLSDAAAAMSDKLCIRIHAFATGHAEADIDAMLTARVKTVLLPGAANGAAVQRLDVGLSVAELRAGLEPGLTSIVAISGDNPSGLLQAASFAGKSRRLAGFGWDAADIAGAIGATRQVTDSGAWSAPMAAARSTLLLTAAACGLPAIDTVSPPCPPDIVRRLCLEARADGFSGKMTRDTAQVSSINAVFGGDAGV